MVDRKEQARGFEVVGDDAGNFAGGLRVERTVGDKVGNGDRQRLDGALGDVELEHGTRRARREHTKDKKDERQPRQTAVLVSLGGLGQGHE